MKTLFLCALSAFLSIQTPLLLLNGDSPHAPKKDYFPELVSRYRLIDVGESSFHSRQHSKMESPPLHLPMINNQGQGVANDKKGGFCFVANGWKYIPDIPGLKIKFHAINDQGDLLISLNRDHDSIEWMVWPHCKEGYGKERIHLYTTNSHCDDFLLTDFNACAVAIGYRKERGENFPIVWNKEQGFHKMGLQQGLELRGIPKRLNRQGSIVGIAQETTDSYPFFWKEALGFEAFKTYRNFLSPNGWTEFADLAITPDDTIYGTFWIKHSSNTAAAAPGNPYYAYVWKPTEAKANKLDLKGMRIADVNAEHTLVGSLNGSATVCYLNASPIELSLLIDPESLHKWKLTEATSINDKGEVVGSGTYDGTPHIFLAIPTF